MKKTIFATMLFAVAAMPLTFAAQTPANPPANGAQTKPSPAAAKKTKKHTAKKAAPKKSTGSTGSTASTPGSGK